MNLENVSEFLIPLERMNSAGHTRLETILHIVINSKVRLNQIGKVFDDLDFVLFKQSLELRDILELVEVLLEFSVQVCENVLILVKDLDQLVLTDLIGVASRLLQLAVLLAEPLVEIGHLRLIILLEGGMLL